MASGHEADPRSRSRAIRVVKKKEDSVLFDGPLGENVRTFRKIRELEGKKKPRVVKGMKKKLKL